VRETFCNKDGTPFTQSPDGYVITTKSYDAAGNVASQAYFDEKETPVMLPAGYQRVDKDYDDKKQVVRSSYFDASGTPAVINSGYASIRYVYDDAGNAIQESYFGADGNPIALSAGYSMVRKAYNDQKKVVRTEYRDGGGSYFPIANGTAVVLNEYDDRGNMISETYLDAQNNRHAISGSGYEYAELRKIYDENNHVIETDYCTANDLLTPGPSGFAVQTYVYDAEGRQVRTSWYDQARNPYVNSKGYVSMITSYNEDGSKADTYVDINGNAVAVQ